MHIWGKNACTYQIADLPPNFKSSFVSAKPSQAKQYKDFYKVVSLSYTKLFTGSGSFNKRTYISGVFGCFTQNIAEISKLKHKICCTINYSLLVRKKYLIWYFLRTHTRNIYEHYHYSQWKGILDYELEAEVPILKTVSRLHNGMQWW